MFPFSSLPSSGQLLLITDQLGAPADFLLHHILSAHLKFRPISQEANSSQLRRNGPKCVVVTVSESLARLKTIGSRMGLNVKKNFDDGVLRFIDFNASFLEHPDTPLSLSLRPTFDLIRDSLDTSASPSEQLLLIWDDIFTLEWIGYPMDDINRFCRALTALCAKRNVALVTRHHLPAPDEPDCLFRSLYQLCAYYVEVRCLASGKSGSVSGEVSLHPGPSLPIAPSLLQHPSFVTRDKALLYRLTDSGAKLFERGAGGVVL